MVPVGTPLPSRGGVGGGVSNFIGCAHNLSQDTLHGCKHLLIAKAEHTDTLLAKIFSSLLIVFVFVIMAGTIEFYAKPMPRAVEVKNIRAYTLLTTKFHAASPTTLQGTPERSFCCGHVAAKSLAILFLFCSVCFSCRIVHRGFSCNNVEICGILF